jgi:hypothetical protein
MARLFRRAFRDVASCEQRFASAQFRIRTGSHVHIARGGATFTRLELDSGFHVGLAFETPFEERE